jgi:RHS repeat-associated protein
VRAGGISQTSLHYTGQRRDETGLLYYHARYYDPALGRFLSADTIVPEVGALAVTPSDSTAAELFDDGGKMSGSANPQELNRYSYANNNPIRYNDPTGHCPFCLAAAGGAAWGAGWSYGSQVWSNYRSGSGWSSFSRNISWRQVGAGVAWGAAGGAFGWGAAAVARRAVGYAAPRASAWISRGGSSCAFNSFSAETPVATPDGPKPISEVELGDQVLAYYEPLAATGSYTVTGLISHQDPVITHLTIAGERLETTPEHAFYTEERRWVPAQDLQVGMHIWRADGTMGRVQSVLQVQQRQRMYNLSVAQAHTFFVGDGAWLVHNCAMRNPGGRLGGMTHRQKVAAVANNIRSRGLVPRQEYYIRTPGASKRGRFVDVAALNPFTGRPVEFHQVGRRILGNKFIPVARERRALRDIRRYTGIRPRFHAYN